MSYISNAKVIIQSSWLGGDNPKVLPGENVLGADWVIPECVLEVWFSTIGGGGD